MENQEQQEEQKGTTAQELAEFIKEKTGKTWEEIVVMLIDVANLELQLKEAYEQAGQTIDMPTPYKALIATVKTLGWGFLIPENDDNELTGMVIGTDEFIDEYLKKLNAKPTE